MLQTLCADAVRYCYTKAYHDFAAIVQGLAVRAVDGHKDQMTHYCAHHRVTCIIGHC